MNFFKKTLNIMNDAIQNFDPSAAVSTAVNTVKEAPKAIVAKKDEIAAKYDDTRATNKKRAEANPEFYDTTSVVWQNTITAMSTTELEALRDKITGLLDI